MGAIVWIKQDKRHYISNDDRYRLFKWEDWHLQDMKHRRGLSSVAIESTLEGIKREAEKYKRRQG